MSRRPKARKPEPYVTAHPGGLFDVGCCACRVVVAGLPDEDTARRWASDHRCAELAADQRRPWP